MMVWEWIRFSIAALFILVGLFILGIAIFGVYRFTYVLNRIHVAAKCDTLGTLLILAGLGVALGTIFPILKLLLIVVFMWIANPVANHLIVQLEVETNRELDKECEVISHNRT